MDKLLHIINIVRTNRGKAPLLSLQPSDTLRGDLGFDSLDMAELTVRIEAEFDIDIFEDGIVSTISEITKRLVDE